MLVIRQKLIMRQDLVINRDVLYIFGDNLKREGLGGQAGEMRGEPNAHGIATKRNICGCDDDYFYDRQKDTIPILKGEFLALRKRIKTYGWWRDTVHYKAIVIPADGIGTGLAAMQQTAPRALKFINDQLNLLERIRT